MPASNTVLQTPSRFHGDEFQVVIFWVVTPCSVAVGYQRFALKMEAKCEHFLPQSSARALASHCISIGRSLTLLLHMRRTSRSRTIELMTVIKVLCSDVAVDGIRTFKGDGMTEAGNVRFSRLNVLK
jgi:hypothetical protein